LATAMLPMKAMKAAKAMKAMKATVKPVTEKKAEKTVAKVGGVACSECGKHFLKAGKSFEKHQAQCDGVAEKAPKKEKEPKDYKEGSKGARIQSIATKSGAEYKTVKDVLEAMEEMKEDRDPEEEKENAKTNAKMMKPGSKGAFRQNLQLESGVGKEDVLSVLGALETVCVDTLAAIGKVNIPGIVRLKIKVKKAKPAGLRWNPSAQTKTQCPAIKASKTARALVLKPFKLLLSSVAPTKATGATKAMKAMKKKPSAGRA